MVVHKSCDLREVGRAGAVFGDDEISFLQLPNYLGRNSSGLWHQVSTFGCAVTKLTDDRGNDVLDKVIRVLPNLTVALADRPYYKAMFDSG